MNLPRPARSLRGGLGLLLSGSLVAAGLVAAAIGGGARAAAGTTGGPYRVYASAGSALAELPVNGLGGAPAAVDSSASGLNTGAIAINSTATLGAVTIEGDGPSLSNVDIFTVPGDSVIGTITSFEPAGLAMDPVDPGRAFAVDSSGNVYALALGAGTVAAPAPLLRINSTTYPSCSSVAVNPSGTTLVVTCVDYSGSAPTAYLAAVSLTARTVVGTWYFPSIYTPVDVAVAPDGSAVYATASSARLSLVLELPISFDAKTTATWSRSIGTPVRTPTSLTVSPDGATVYVGGTNGAGAPGGVAAFSSSAGVPGPSASVPLYTDPNNTGLTSITMSPDGRTLLAMGRNQPPSGAPADERIYPVSVAPGTLTVGPPSASLGGANSYPYGPQGIAVTPDQAPVANLAPASGTAGSPLTLDASSSNVVYGSISRYVWSFGDGSPSVSTNLPAVTHVYATAGGYTASVVETDSAGTSVPPASPAPGSVDGPGTTPYLEASPGAAGTATVAIGIPGGPPPTTAAPHHGPSTTSGHPSAYHPVIKLDRAVGSPGDIMTVTGQGFPPGRIVKVEWSTKTYSFQEGTDSHGNLPAHAIFLLTPDVLGPRLAVATVTGTSLSAQAKFLVVAGTARPGGDSGDFLFRSEGP